MIKKTVLAHLSIILANIIYGLNYSIAKEIMPEYIQAYALTICRVVVASVMFWGFSLFYESEKIEKKDRIKLILAAVFGIALNQLMFLKGLSYTLAIDASIIMTVNPVLVLLVSALIVGEVINLRKISGITIGATGAILLILMSEGDVSFASNNFLGNLLVFLNALSYGIYLVIVKTLMNKYRPVTVLKWIFPIGLFIIFPVAYDELIHTHWQAFTPAIWWAFAYVLIASTFLAYLLNVFGLQYVNASTVSIYIYSQPVIASVVAIIFLHEHLNIIKIIAALLVFIGVYLVSTKNKKKSKKLTMQNNLG